MKPAARCYRYEPTVMLAGGSWTTKHIVRDLPEACRDAYRSFIARHV